MMRSSGQKTVSQRKILFYSDSDTPYVSLQQYYPDGELSVQIITTDQSKMEGIFFVCPSDGKIENPMGWVTRTSCLELTAECFNCQLSVSPTANLSRGVGAKNDTASLLVVFGGKIAAYGQLQKSGKTLQWEQYIEPCGDQFIRRNQAGGFFTVEQSSGKLNTFTTYLFMFFTVATIPVTPVSVPYGQEAFILQQFSNPASGYPGNLKLPMKWEVTTDTQVWISSIFF